MSALGRGTSTAEDIWRFLDPAVLAQISNLELRARHVVEGLMSGIHRSRAHGFSVEFEEHRPYTPGDEMRHIDWKAYGKFDRYLIKQYENETNVEFYLVVDASESMDIGEGIHQNQRWTKWDHAATLAASIAHLLLKQGDAVGLEISNEYAGQSVPARSVRRHLTSLLANLSSVRPEGQTVLSDTLNGLAGRLKRRSMVAVVSDLFEKPVSDREVLAKAFRMIRLRGNDVIVFQVLDPLERKFPFEGLVRFEDVEKKVKTLVECEAARVSYLRRLNEFMEFTKSRCQSEGIHREEFDTDENLGKALTRFLAWRSSLVG